MPGLGKWFSLLVRREEDDDVGQEVTRSHPLPVTVEQPVTVYGTTVNVGPFLVPGVVAAALYTAGDAMGTVFSVNVPKSGVIQSALFYDLDDEGVTMELWLFRDLITGVADNAAFGMSDADLLLCEGVIIWSSATTPSAFKDAVNNQIATVDAIAKSYIAPKGRLWGQMVTRGGPTIAAGNEPQIALRIIPDAETL